MSAALRVLVIEDHDPDAQILIATLRRAGWEPTWTRVDDRQALVDALASGTWDLVFCDWSMPALSASEALALCQQRDAALPFIAVSGVVDEDVTGELLRAGARDFFVKGRFSRLGAAVRRELASAEERRESERRRAASSEAEALLRTILDSTADGILVVGERGEVLAFNRRFQELWRIPDAVAAARDDHALLDHVGGQLLDLDGFRAEVERLYRTSEEHWDTLRFKDGRVVERFTRPLALGARPARLWSFRDVTEKQRSDRALELERGRLRTLIRTIPDPVWLKDQQGVYLACNAALERLFGVGESEIIGRNDLAFATTEEAERFRQKDLEAVAAGGPSEGEEWLTSATDGRRALYQVIKTPMYDGDGALVGVLGIAHDVTAARKAEQELRTLSVAIAQSPLSVVITDAAGDIEYVNPAFVRVTGYPSDEVLGRNPRLLKSQLTPRETHEELWRTITAGRVWHGELCNRRKSGEHFWEEAWISPVVEESGVVTHYVAIEEDISERKVAEASLRRFVSGSPAVIYALRVENGKLAVAWASENLRTLTGHDQSEIEARGWWRSNLHPEDRERVLAAHPRPYETDHQILEFRFRKKSGEYLWIRDEKRLLRDAYGAPSEVVGSWSDVSERVRLEEQLRLAQKIEAIGRLAGGIAHDFNNLLTVINGNAELLLSELPASNPGRALLGDIRDAGDRAAVLTRQLLAFSRKQVLSPKTLNLNEAISRFESILRRLIGEDITLVTMLAPDLGNIRVDPAQLEQVVLNLAVNARDAMPQGGRLTIETREVVLDAEHVRRRPYSREGRHVVLTVRDTGSGMTEEVRSHLFEPFFTTKAPGQGTGLGLAMVFGTVKQSEGHIEVESEPGLGTTFEIHFPVVGAEPVREPSGERSATPPPAGHETILVVEDEPSVRRIVRTVLERKGYRVLEAENGARALEAAAAHAGPIHLLISDVVMPQMGGHELAERLLRSRPTMRVLYLSGYVQDEAIHEGISRAQAAFLTKPVSAVELARKVRAVLDDAH